MILLQASLSNEIFSTIISLLIIYVAHRLLKNKLKQ